MSGSGKGTTFPPGLVLQELSKIADLVKRERDYEVWEVKKDLREKFMPDWKEKIRVIRLGVPRFVFHEDKWLPYAVVKENKSVTIKSGLHTFTIHNENKVEFSDPDGQNKAIETISLLQEGSPLSLKWKERTEPSATRNGGIKVTQIYTISGDTKSGTLSVTYRQDPGRALQHIVKTDGLSDEKLRALKFTYDFKPDKVNIAKIESCGSEPQIVKLSGVKTNLRNDGTWENVTIWKGDENTMQKGEGFVIGEIARANRHLIGADIDNTTVEFNFGFWYGDVTLEYGQIYESYDPNIDGHVRRNGTSYSKTGGWPYPALTYSDTYVASANDLYRAFYEWPLPPLQGTIIGQVIFRFETSNGHGDIVDYKALGTVKPLTASAQNIFNQIGGGAVLGSSGIGTTNPAGSTEATGPNRVTILDAAGVADVQNRIDNGTNWCGFGMMFNIENTNFGKKVRIRTEEANPTPKPKIELWV